MKRLLLNLSVATAIAINVAPMSVYAAKSTAASINYQNICVHNPWRSQCLLINSEEAVLEKLKNLLEKREICLDTLFQNGCIGGGIFVPKPSVPEIPAPEETQPAPTEPEISIPEVTEPETPLPETSEPEVTEPEMTLPEISEPEVTEPEMTLPETQIPEATEPETTFPETQAPIPSIPETSAPETESPSEDATEPSETLHPYVLRIVELVNEERAKAGLNPVTLDMAASQAALVRAKEIVSSFSHTRPDGRSCFTALEEQGVNYRLAGENIAWGQRSPEQVMEGWMNSSGHRANILKESFTHIGIGYYQENGVNYWTQLFFSK